MAPRKRTFAGTIAVLILLAAAQGAVRAEDGSLNAIAYEAVPRGSAVSIRLLDNSNENLALAVIFERELKARGYIVAERAPLVLTVETRDDIGAWSTGDRRTVLELQAHTGGGSRDIRDRDEASMRLNLFDSRSGGIFNEGNADRTAIVTPSSYRLDVSIEDSRDGKRLWQAWAVANVTASKGESQLQILVPIVVGAIGQTVKQAPIALTNP